MLLYMLVLPTAVSGALLSDETLARRSLTRFQRNHSDHAACWERHGVDGFFTVIDAHNHFRPFGGPPVPFHTYIQWMLDHGILFSTMFGIGQLLVKANPRDPDCCYYLHCPSFNYSVVPDPYNDRLNAEDYTHKYQGNSSVQERIHLTLSATFPNLQNPKNISRDLRKLEAEFPGAFGWAGEINVFKHALASNGFFNQPRVTERMVLNGDLDYLFNVLTDRKWPTTLHCDLGCDNYLEVPVGFDSRNPLKGCEVPNEEIQLATQNYVWWRAILGPYYHSFFFTDNRPRKTFSKVQHLKVWDTILSRHKNLVVVWAHLGLSKELSDLHPNIHYHILKELFDRHPNLHADVSWDVLSKQNLMNHVGEDVSKLNPEKHVDFNQDVRFLFNDTEVNALREDLHATWSQHEELVKRTGTVTGPTYAMAIYLQLFHEYADRFLTGTDFVASLGPKEQYPGQLGKNGCMKDVANHARQLTDTSSINMFFEDEAFRKIVLGENFFRITGLGDSFAAPPVCGDSMLPVEAIVGIIVAVVALLLIALLVVVVLVCCCRKGDNGASFTRVGENRSASATTNV